jgi:hypothetical protein
MCVAASYYTPAFFCLQRRARSAELFQISCVRSRVNLFLRCNLYANLYAEITLIQKALMLFCVATNKCATEVKGGPMFGIAVMFLVSTVVLMALSAVEG